MESTDLQRVNFEEGYVAVIDKPYRWSSTDVVRKVKFELRKAGYRRIKVGHAGTLDPLATGVLLVCIGRATKRVDALQAERKEYIAGVRLGATTPSFDREHTVDRTFPTDHITRPEVERALASLVGERLQTPPLYSAKKIEGTRAYEFTVADAMVSNFHLPYSTQLMMVAAFGGYDCVMNAYKIAREEGYRFGTYGDAMLLL